MDLHESIARSVATAGSAVVFAGTTVVIALAALVLSGLPILAQMGLVAAATVAVTVARRRHGQPGGARADEDPRWCPGAAGARTASPPPATSPTRTVTGDEREEEHGAWYVGLVTRHPWLTVVGVVALLGVAAIPVSQIQLGLPDGGSEATGTSAHTAYTTIADEFGPGVNGPIIAVATLPEQDSARTDAEVLAAQAAIATDLMAVDGVTQRAALRRQRRQVAPCAFQVVPTTGPADPATVDTVQAIHFSADTYAPAHRHRDRPHRPDRRQHRDLRSGSARPCRPTCSSSSGSRSSS